MHWQVLQTLNQEATRDLCIERSLARTQNILGPIPNAICHKDVLHGVFQVCCARVSSSPAVAVGVWGVLSDRRHRRAGHLGAAQERDNSPDTWALRGCCSGMNGQGILRRRSGNHKRQMLKGGRGVQLEWALWCSFISLQVNVCFVWRIPVWHARPPCSSSMRPARRHDRRCLQ